MRFDFRSVCHAHHRIIVEIALLDASVLDGDLPVKGGGEAVDDGTLDLHRNRARIDDVAAIDRHHHTLDPHLARAAHRDLGNFADDGAEGFVDGDTPARAGGERLTQSPFSASVSSTCRKSARPASKARR